jgi:hypothetical protein
MKKTSAILIATVAVIGFAGAANATTTYDQSLGGKGVYFGSGNTDNHFTVDTETGVQIGLTAVQRYIGNYTPNAGTGTYDVATGLTGVSGKTGSDWGITYSVDLTGGLNLSQISTIFSMQDLDNGTPAQTLSGALDLKGFADNGTTDGVTTCPGNGVVCSLAGAAVGFQNSQPGSYLGSVLDTSFPGFNVNANDTYLFSLQVLDVTGRQIGIDSITVVAGTGAAVPEPVTLSIFGAGLVGAIGFARRRKAKKA